MRPNALQASVLAGVLLLGGILPSQATPVTWTLNDVTFDDGTMASGFFEFDAATHTSSSFNISTTDGMFSAHTYDTGNSHMSARPVSSGRWNLYKFQDDVNGRYLSFWLDQQLSDIGGIVNIVTDNSWGYECTDCETARWMVAGSLTAQSAAAVPEPGSLAMVLPGLGMLGFLARRRRSRTA
jgi:hypothetical protein